MLHTNVSADPDIHRAAAKIANRIVSMMRQVLRDEERELVLTNAYLIAREEMEAARKP